MAIDKDLHKRLKDIVYQQFKLSSSNERHPRPEGVVLLVDNVPFPGHAASGRSAVADALSTLKLSLKAGKAKISDHPVTFAIAAVGVSEDDASINMLSPGFLRDLKRYKGAAGLTEIEVIAGHTEDSYVYKLPARTPK